MRIGGRAGEKGVTVFTADRSVLLLLVGFVALVVAAAKLYDRNRWAPLAGVAATLAYFFVVALLTGGRPPEPESSRLKDAAMSAGSFALPVTLSMLGIWFARRRSVGFRVAVGLGLAILVTPLLLVGLVLVGFWAHGASP